MGTIEDTYGPGSSGDSVLIRQARLQQAWYRVHVRGVHTCGQSPDSGGPLRSYLPVGHERDNFISEQAYLYAMERLDDKATEPDLTIAADRLKYNMLSSQPMCFNLFADIRAGVAHGDPLATPVVEAMFPDIDIEHVDSVIVEEVPHPPSDYIHDKTGWDASLRINGGMGLLTIETKYTDTIDTGRPKRDNPELLAVAKKSGIFTDDGLDYYRDLGGFDQLARNLLLTVVYAQRNVIPFSVNYVLAPAFDRQAQGLVKQMRGRLAEHHVASIQFRTLDNVVDAALTIAQDSVAEALLALRLRYLDLGPAKALLGDD